ncbi:MAG: phage holin family protein [Gallionella sp.]|nr:phage holin family protein [Gallionella sp.]MDD4945860.1 phage holin family protein [Gallionella sp.]
MSGVHSGLMGSVRRLLSTLLDIASTRLELLANEIYEERLHLEQMLLYLLSALFCIGMSIMLLTVFIVVLFWDDYRLGVLGGAATLFLVSGLLLAGKLRALTRVKSKLFSVSLAELGKDRVHLDGDNGAA